MSDEPQLETEFSGWRADFINIIFGKGLPVLQVHQSIINWVNTKPGESLQVEHFLRKFGDQKTFHTDVTDHDLFQGLQCAVEFHLNDYKLVRPTKLNSNEATIDDFRAYNRQLVTTMKRLLNATKLLDVRSDFLEVTDLGLVILNMIEQNLVQIQQEIKDIIFNVNEPRMGQLIEEENERLLEEVDSMLGIEEES